jgi:hypothetical protein
LARQRFKADSHIPCRSHAVPLLFPCRDPATTLPFSESALFHTGHCISDWYDSDNKLPGTSIGKWPTCRHPAAATLPRTCHELAMALRGRFQKGIFVAWQGNGMACVNQTWLHCVNQMGNTQSKALVERHGRGTAGEWQRNGRGTAWYM